MTERSSRSSRRVRVARRLLSTAVTLGVCLSPFFFTKALAPNSETLQVGPVYTSADGKQTPEFPLMKIVVSPPGQQQTPPLAGDLTLVEDGVDGGHATEVTTFDGTGYGLAAVVAIDVSGSMAGKPINILRGSLYKFVSDARPQDRVGVVTIADDATWDVPFGTDQETTKTRLQAMKTRGTKTRLYDGLLTALGGFDGPVPARRELTVISDGHDEGSRSTLEQVVQAARDGGIAIDAIGLTRSAPEYLKTLRTLASQTGGSFQQVHSDKELDTLIGNGMNRLKATPVASFEAQHISGDGQRHKLSVRLSAGGGAFGETAFISPKQGGTHMPRSLRHMPPWGYGVLAVVCLALLFAAVFAIRRLRRNDAVRDVPYALPPQPSAPPPPFAGGLSQGNGFAGDTFPPGGFGREAETAGMKTPVPIPRTPPAAQPSAQPPAQSSARHKQTRLAGIFESADGAIARLDILTGALSGTSVEVLRGEFWIGAAPGNQFVISNDATVSSRHAYLIFEDPILILVDNRSTNGTRVNGKLLRGSRQPVRDGDQIQIGQTLLRLRSVG